MTIAPMPGKLLVQRFSPPTATESGILLPPTVPTHEALQRGVVLSVGAPVLLASGVAVEPRTKTGDTVVFPYRAGEEFIQGETKVLLMDETSIRAIEE